MSVAQIVHAITEVLKGLGCRLSLSIPIRETGYTKTMAKWKYFSEQEVEGLEPEFVAKLDMARHEAGVPFKITSGKRSSADNERAMGVEGSAHIKGLAVDLACDDSSTRFRMVRSLFNSGIERIGVYDRHIHVDVDPEKPRFVLWVGISH